MGSRDQFESINEFLNRPKSKGFETLFVCLGELCKMGCAAFLSWTLAGTKVKHATGPFPFDLWRGLFQLRANVHTFVSWDQTAYA